MGSRRSGNPSGQCGRRPGRGSGAFGEADRRAGQQRGQQEEHAQAGPARETVGEARRGEDRRRRRVGGTLAQAERARVLALGVRLGQPERQLERRCRVPQFPEGVDDGGGDEQADGRPHRQAGHRPHHGRRPQQSHTRPAHPPSRGPRIDDTAADPDLQGDHESAVEQHEPGDRRARHGGVVGDPQRQGERGDGEVQ